MTARTYVCGTSGTVKRLDDLVGVTTPVPNPNWVDVSFALGGIASGTLLTNYDVETDPTNGDKVIVVGTTSLGNNPLYYGIAYSSNKGVTWTIPGGSYITSIGVLGVIPLFREVTWVNANIVYAVDQSGVVVKSTDGGLTFAICSPLPVTMTEAWSIHFATPLVGIVGGTDRSAITTDGGVTWTEMNGGFSFTQTTGNTGKIQGCLLMPTLTDISLTGENFQMVSTDGGATFTIAISFDTINGKFGQHLTWYNDGTQNCEVVEKAEARVQGIGGFIIPGQVIIPGAVNADDHTGAYMHTNNAGFLLTSYILSVGGKIEYSVNNFNILIPQDYWTGIAPEAVWTWVDTNPPGPNYCGCPSGYTFNSTTGQCEQVSSTPPVITNPQTVVHNIMGFGAAGEWGANLYPDLTGAALPILSNALVGIPISPPGSFAPNPTYPFQSLSYGQLSDGLLNPFLSVNTIPNTSTNQTWGTYRFPFPSPVQIIGGRLLTNSIWNSQSVPAPDEWWGIEFCVNIPVTKKYILGFAVVEFGKLSLNTQLILDLEGSGWNFSDWKLFPITLNAGNNVFKLEAKFGIVSTNYGVGFEIYDATFPQLQAVTSPATLAPYILFTTTDLVGETVTSGDTTGMSCDPGCTLNVCGLVPICDCITTVPFNPCCYLLVDCAGLQADIVTNTDVASLIGQVINTLEFPGCWTVDSQAPGCQGSIPVTVTNIFVDCTSCAPVCYDLVECATGLTTKVSDDYGPYVGQIVQLANSGTKCWQVFIALDCTGAIDSGTTVTVTFSSCATCSPAIPPPVDLHPRRVKPGYYTQGCSPEYTEKVNCTFGEQVYNIMLQKRYGITTCCEEDLEKWVIKKQLLDFRAIFDPDLCKSTLTRCCPPTCLTTEIQIFNPTIACDPPNTVVATLQIPPLLCPPPQNVTVGLIVPTIPPCVCYHLITTSGTCVFDYTDCNGVPQTIVPSAPVDTYICSTTVPIADPSLSCLMTGFTVTALANTCTPNNTCGPPPPCDCYQITVSNINQTFSYIDCNGVAVFETLSNGVYFRCGSNFTTLSLEVSFLLTGLNCGLGECVPPLPICTCYQLTMSAIACEFAYIDCTGTPQLIFAFGTMYVCSTVLPVATGFCPPATYTITATAFSCGTGSCGP